MPNAPHIRARLLSQVINRAFSTATGRGLLLTLIVSTLLFAIGCQAAEVKEPTPQEIMTQASDKFAGLESLHFRVDAENAKLVIGPGLTTSSLEGDVTRPNRMKVEGTSNMAGMALELRIIAVGDQVWFSNPLTKKWEKMPGSMVIPDVLGENGVAKGLRTAENLERQPDATVDGVASYHLTGQLDPAALGAVFGPASSGKRVPGEIWIGKDDFLVRQVRLNGPVVDTDPPNAVRTVRLSQFNVPMQIEPPAA